MKITVDGKSYGVTLAQNALGESIAAMCPMKLTLSRSGEHEYYAALPGNLLGQVCPQYAACWFFLSIPCSGLAYSIRRWMFPRLEENA